MIKPVLLGAILSTLVAGSALAQPADKLRLGFITDMSSAYADGEGKGGAVAIQMAIDDFGGKVLGRRVELVTADHQNKADIAASKVREWIDTGDVTMVFGGANSGTALASAKVAEEKKRVYFNSSAAAAALTNEACTAYTVHYAYDTVGLARGTGTAVVDQGGKSWFFLSADYAFGKALQADVTKVVEQKGGTVLGSARHPINASDFASFLMQAQTSKAQVLALANAGGDTVNAIKAVREFGIGKTMKVAGLFVLLNDIHSLGLENTQGLLHTTSWYWDLDDPSRKFASAFFAKMGRMHAADYSATMTYLKAVQAAGTVDADKVMAQLKSGTIDDFYAKGYIRQDGRYVHDLYLVQVKTPAESRNPWDYLKVVQRLPGEQVFTSKAESKCALWR